LCIYDANDPYNDIVPSFQGSIKYLISIKNEFIE